jgi:stage II sporulation protein D
LFSDKPYKVLDTESGQVMEVSVRDYVIGAVCAEMPASFGEEALKAQAVAAHTYAERQRLRESESPTPELMGVDFSDDTSKYQGFFTKEEIKERFGDRFERDYGKISAAADEVLPYILTYDEAPIIAAFHSMSAGFTESAENAWGLPCGLPCGGGQPLRPDGAEIPRGQAVHGRGAENCSGDSL